MANSCSKLSFSIMLGKICNSIKKLSCSESYCLSRRNQVGRDQSLHDENLATKWVICDACVEANRACSCGQPQHPPAEANSSFAHAVINMIGMLIGNTCSSSYIYAEVKKS